MAPVYGYLGAIDKKGQSVAIMDGDDLTDKFMLGRDGEALNQE